MGSVSAADQERISTGLTIGAYAPFLLEKTMRDMLIDRIYQESRTADVQITEDLRTKSNSELLDIFAELVIEHYLFEQYLWEK